MTIHKSAASYVFVGIAALLLIFIDTNVSTSTESSPHVYTDAVITLTDDGFSPREIVLARGGTVTFISKEEVFWPASDYHPSHDQYPGFDARKPLPPNQEWSYTFETPGSWSFHDHLHPNFTGTIKVVGDGTTLCEKRMRGHIRPECWQQDVVTMLKTKGIETTFDEFEILYRDNPEFTQNCHDFMHVLGKAAYRQFGNDGEPISHASTRYCGFGFYHGFIEEMLNTRGLVDLDEASRYCVSVRYINNLPSRTSAHNAEMACYHGIGHALFDSSPSEIWGNAKTMIDRTIASCEKMTRIDDKRRACASGVYNALANAYGANTYGLSYGATYPAWICDSQKAFYRSQCHPDMVSSYVYARRLSIDESIAVITSLPHDAAKAGLYGYIDTIVRYPLVEMSQEDIASLCLSLRGNNLTQTCINGAVIGYTRSGDAGTEYEKSVEFCSQFEVESHERALCFSETGKTLNVFFAQHRIRTICETLSARDATACIAGALDPS